MLRQPKTPWVRFVLYGGGAAFVNLLTFPFLEVLFRHLHIGPMLDVLLLLVYASMLGVFGADLEIATRPKPPEPEPEKKDE